MRIHKQINVGAYGDMAKVMADWATKGTIINTDWVQRWFVVEVIEHKE